MVQLKSVIKWGGIALGTALSVFGIVSQAKEAGEWGLPSWTWITIGWVITVGALLFIIYGFWRENIRLRKGESPYKINKVREGRIKYRQIYANRTEIPRLLLQLQQYTLNEVAKQQVSLEDAKHIPMELFKATNKLAIIPALIWFSLPRPLKRFIKIEGFLAQALLNWNAVLKRYNLGAMVVAEQKPYKDLYQQIVEYKVGLPSIITAKIEMCVLMSDLLSSTVLFATSQEFKEQLQSSAKGWIVLPYVVKGIDLNADKLRGQVAEAIEKFLLGE